MKAAWYEKQGAARDVLVVGKMDDPQPPAGEVRIRVAFSGVNPGDVQKREDAFGVGMPYPRVIPHSDGSGTVDAVGERGGAGMGRSPHLVLRRSILSSVRNRCRVHSGSAEAGGSAPRRRAIGARCLSRYSGHNRSSGGSRRGFGQGQDRSCARRCWCSWRLCRSTRASGGSASDRYVPC
jgi:hypothetical protein